MDEHIVTIADGPRYVTFASTPSDNGHSSSESGLFIKQAKHGPFVVKLSGDGIQTDAHVAMGAGDWESLAKFFEGLARTWRPHEPSRSWHSTEHHLTIHAKTSSRGHCELSFTVNDDAWTATLGEITIDRGQNIKHLATKVRRWVDQARVTVA